MSKKSFTKRIVLGVTGSIACYKAAELARRFVKRRYDVRVVMTDSAKQFVNPLTFEALTGHPVTCSFWSESQAGAIGHIQLADWADVVVIAPATADVIAKLTIGGAESPLLAVALATKAPIVIAPAMNVNMWEHPQTQVNLNGLRAKGVHVVSPESGALACGWVGSGRLASVGEIVAETERAVGPRDLQGKRVVVVAGPTREPLDPVRFLSNRSSGKMGIALALEAYRRGAHVSLVHGPLTYSPTIARGITRVPVVTACEMRDVVFDSVFGEVGADVVVMAAAVADFRPSVYSDTKIKKKSGTPVVSLEKNPDILSELGARRGKGVLPKLIGFAVETGDEAALIAEAQGKLAKKSADFIVGNLANEAFEGDTNRVWIVGRDGRITRIRRTTKRAIARRIWDAVSHVQRKGDGDLE